MRRLIPVALLILSGLSGCLGGGDAENQEADQHTSSPTTPPTTPASPTPTNPNEPNPGSPPANSTNETEPFRKVIYRGQIEYDVVDGNGNDTFSVDFNVTSFEIQLSLNVTDNGVYLLQPLNASRNWSAATFTHYSIDGQGGAAHATPSADKFAQITYPANKGTNGQAGQTLAGVFKHTVAMPQVYAWSIRLEDHSAGGSSMGTNVHVEITIIATYGDREPPQNQNTIGS